MTDKHIIIDGVDVSECEKLGETIDGITCGLGKRIRFANKIITKHNLCKNNPNCYYKQLQREKQSSQEAIDTSIREFNRAEELKTLLKRKEQECEEFKKQLERTEENYQKLLSKSNKYIHNLVDENVQDISNLARQLDQLKAKGQAEQKLERITNILFAGQCSNCEGYSPNCSNKELCDFKHNIKNIIDEVEDD